MYYLKLSLWVERGEHGVGFPVLELGGLEGAKEFVNSHLEDFLKAHKYSISIKIFINLTKIISWAPRDSRKKLAIITSAEEQIV